MVHFEKQRSVVSSQPNGAQGMLAAAVQAPPLHTLASPTAVPSAWQRPVAHTVPSGWLRQAPLPSHRPSGPQVAAGCDGHWLGSTGASPSGTGEQVPIRPGTLQAWQVPVQALLQQTPSTQLPLPHSSWQPQASPMPIFIMGARVQAPTAGRT